MLPAIFGLSGLSPTQDELAFFKESDPAGYILFGRNVESRSQVRALTDALRNLHGRDDLLIMIDQEGGRVQRMKAPHWPAFPPGLVFDRLYDIAPISAIQAARLNARALAHNLAEVGITSDALPLLDVRQEGAHDVIGDRALGCEPLRVAALGRAILDGLADGGVIGIVKHMPGHGRANCDSHKDLPRVCASAQELERDLAPFISLSAAPMAMTAHIVYEAWDTQRPATQSPAVIDEIIRTRIGFDGLLMSDDIDMEALSGSIGERAEMAVKAGCDVVLNCWGKMADMQDIAARAGAMSHKARSRLDLAMAAARIQPESVDFADLLSERDALLALVMA